jgi:hypothetical protein
MAVGIYFSPPSMNAQQYEETLKQLEQAGQGSPRGRLYHTAFGPPDHLMVFDIWDSQENFDAFGGTLMPILSQIGIDPGQPDIMPVHKIIQG